MTPDMKDARSGGAGALVTDQLSEEAGAVMEKVAVTLDSSR